jgi:hypothetical protein
MSPSDSGEDAMAKVHVTITDESGGVLRHYTIEEASMPDETTLADEIFNDDETSFDHVEDQS